MKKPEQPPPFNELMHSAAAVVEKPAFRAWMSRPDIDGRYRHWSKLKHLTPPEGLTTREWWFAIKLARLGGRKTIPLKDRHGRAFSYVLTDTAQKLIYDLSVGLGGQLQLQEQVLNRQSQDHYYVNSLIEESITSSQLEGATTTRKVAEDMLRSGRKPRSAGEIMILNNYRAMLRVGEMIQDKLTPEKVFELHRILTEGTLESDSEAGRFRRPDETVAVYDNVTNEVLHQPPAAAELPDRLAAMCKLANAGTEGEFIHPIVRAILLHFWLAHDHPFTDGNGRVARALFYWSIRRAGHWLSEFVSISSILVKAPVRYAMAYLYTESDDNDLSYFILYHLHVLKQATEALHRYIQRRVDRVRQLADRLQGMDALNHRQRELMAHALRHPRQEYSIESHRQSHNVVYQTARRDLLDLEERGYLRRTKRGQEFIFRAVPDLEQRLLKP
jgi:Fic family protein